MNIRTYHGFSAFSNRSFTIASTDSGYLLEDSVSQVDEGGGLQWVAHSREGPKYAPS